MKRGGLIILLMLALTFACFAQQKRESGEKIIADLMERWIENEESTVDYTDLQDQLEYFLKHKINLNKTNRFELEQLQLLDDASISAILRHRELFGDYVTVYELQTIEQISERTLYYLFYFVTTESDIFDDRTSLLNRLRAGKQEVMLLYDRDLEDRKGYSLNANGSVYEGAPFRQVVRYRFASGNKLMFGFAAEKDAGEPMKAAQGGYDFYSGHLMVRNWGRIEALALGDYQVSFGQGLTFGSGMAPRKSAYVLNVRRNFQTIRPYRSLNESGFLRGAALTYKLGKTSCTVFGSYKQVTVSLAQTADGAVGFSSVQQSGLHRTATERANKNDVHESVAGVHFSYQQQQLKVGVTGAVVHFDKLMIASPQLFKVFDKSQQTFANIGFDYEYQWRNIQLFGEAARSNNGGLALLSGLTASLHATLDMVCLYRNYGSAYQSIYNNTFGEYGDGRNEIGMYTGLSFKPTKRWVLNLYVDVYRSPWLRYLVDAPSRGTDYLAEIQYNPSKQTQLYVRYHNEIKYANVADAALKVDFPDANEREQIRFHARYPMSDHLTGNSRLEWVVFTNAMGLEQHGSIIFQDIQYSSKQQRVSFSGRVALFSVDDYSARVYANESDVLYQYSVPMYQNSGIRLLGVVHVRVNRHLDCWLKCSRTEYSNVQQIGSGLDQIDGNTLTDIRVQARLRF